MSVDRAEITRLLSEALGPNQLSSSLADTAAHALDFWPRARIAARDAHFPRGPRWVVWPGATAEISQVLRIASAYAIPVLPHGAGSSLVGGAAPPGDGDWIALSTRRMSDVLDFDEGSLRVQVQAGILGVELEEWLNARGYSLGHVPTSMSNATLGGWLATRSAGLLSSRYGRISDLCLSVTAVLADGQVIRARAAPLRAAGPDLLHLLLGSEGTLGVLSAAELVVHRLPLHRQFEAFAFDTLAEAAAGLSAVLGQGLSPLVARAQPDARSAARPGDSADGSGPQGASPAPERDTEAERWLVFVAFEGPPARVDAELEQSRRVLEAHGGSGLGPAPARRWWGQRFAATFHFGPRLAAPSGVADQVDLGVPWSRVAPVHDAVMSALRDLGLRARPLLEHARPAGACLCVPFWGAASSDASALALYDRAWERIAAAAAAHGAWVADVFGGGRHRSALLDPAARQRLAVLAAVKQRLDPAGVLNPGVLGVSP